ncbi:hypothetical protein BDQ17DRAFT_1350180 [Cyathus striatus]|nr:hypothetical protein BDQ17DRAFT_1350180 [Cyathus striatus]
MSESYGPRWSCAGPVDVSAALGRKEREIVNRKQGRLKTKASKLRIAVAPEHNDDDWISWWADDPPSLPPTPISPLSSFFTSLTSPTASSFSSSSSFAPDPMPPLTHPTPLRSSKSLSVLADRSPSSSRPSARQMFAKIKKFATKSSSSLRKDKERDLSPARPPIPIVSFASNHSVVSVVEPEVASDTESFVPYLPLVAQYERDARSIKSAAKSSEVQRTPLSPSPSIASIISIRSVSTASTATEPHSPVTPVTPNFGVQDELAWDCLSPTSPDFPTSYASSPGPVRSRTRTTSNPNRPSNIPWINRRPSMFLAQKQPVKPPPTLPLPRVPGAPLLSPPPDIDTEYDFYDEVRDCEGVRQIRARKEAFWAKHARRGDDGEWTLFLGAEGIEEVRKKRHSANAQVSGAEEYWAGERKKKAEGRKRVKSETRPPSSRAAEDWTLSLPLPMPATPGVQSKTSVTIPERDANTAGSDGSLTPTENKPKPHAEAPPRLSTPSNSSRTPSPAPSTGSRRVESIRRPLPFGPSPSSPSSTSPVSPVYALARFPSTSSIASAARLPSVLAVRSPTVIAPTSWRATKGRSGGYSSGEESIPRPPKTTDSVASTGSTSTITPAEKPSPVIVPAEEEFEPSTPKATYASVPIAFGEEDEDTDSSSVYYSAQSHLP